MPRPTSRSRHRLLALTVASLAALAACVPPTPAPGGWTRVTPDYPGRFTGATISGDGNVVLSQIPETNRISIDRISPREHTTFDLGEFRYGHRLSHDGRYAFSLKFEFLVDILVMKETTYRLDVATGEEIEVGEFSQASASLSADGRSAARLDICGDDCDATLVTWTDSEGERSATVPVRGTYGYARLSRDGRTLTALTTAVTSGAPTTSFWQIDTATGATRSLAVTLPAGMSYANLAWVSGDGAVVRIQGGEADGAQVAYDLREGADPVRLTGCATGNASPNGRYCAEVAYDTATFGRILRVSDLESGTGRLVAQDDRDQNGPRIDAPYGPPVADDGRVALGYHSTLEPDWPVYVVGP